jgi:hypothetical protein
MPAAAAPTEWAQAPAGFLVDPEDPQVVPAALAGLVAAAHTALRVMEVNGHYSPQDAVATLEGTTAVLDRLADHVEPYAGDYSKAAAKSTGTARDLLRQARTALSAARHHLALDETASSARPLVKTAPTDA